MLNAHGLLSLGKIFQLQILNCLSNDKIFDLTKSKASGDDKLNVANLCCLC